ncbi:hypothetical protein [Streptomyces sp. MJP52]|uniref:hypothetical protein n=1 Tax=Streptomyces sp. MJP52 TaxID=2940555 RepID=UPI00247596A0|nr:hypothetical protein [Streptomyces sp. MJP52]MDH6228172.1 hypothetical protein [Streptomyces sp. MJP52]
MQKGTPEYDDARNAVVEILRDQARHGAKPLRYGDLSRRLAELGHDVPAYGGPLPYLLEDASLEESPDGSHPMLSALVVLQDTGWPSGGFFKLARRAPFNRSGEDETLWITELNSLAKHYAET